MILGVLYWALKERLDTVPMMVTGAIEFNGNVILISDIDRARQLEQIINARSLDLLAQYSVLALVVLFVIALLIGWIFAGRALHPVDRITAVAREIEASDLSRRIELTGPDDELTRMADTFDAMLDRLDVAFQSQRQFLAETSHDLRTPLTVVRSNIDLALSDPGTSEEEWRETADIVKRNAERMSSMIDDLLATARLQIGKATLVDLDLASVVAQVTNDLREPARDDDVEIEDAGEPATVTAVPVTLTRALTNLADNAIRFARSKVVLGSGRVGEWAWFGAADDGPGFDPSTTETEMRRGLGLRIVREVASAHGGSLVVHDRPAGGTSMVIWLPALPGAGPHPSMDPLRDFEDSET
ncbi:MAG: HAMP domain-containing protein [Acidimicrobiia bacterium]|nr:HAMP domain-containing protein [Acidimicrobiia bacterium]